MTETVAEARVPSPAVKAKKPKTKSTGAKKPKVKADHPPTSTMVNAAIKTLKERGGSSLPAIKKYIAGTYKVDVEKMAPFIRRYLKSAVHNGKLIQTKGKGAAGSFKLPTQEKVAKPKASKPKGVKKATKPKTVKPKGEKKVTKAKKPSTTAAKAAKKTGSVAPIGKSPKPKKVANVSKKTVKSKSPKVKKVKASKKTAKA